MIENLDKGKIPSHIAVIMDGNGRWAKKKGSARIFGHQSAVKSVRDVTEGCAELGVSYLTLYAFSTENWSRPEFEVNALMKLLVSTIKKETPTLLKNNIRLNAIGHVMQLPTDCQQELQEAIKATAHNDGMVLNLALSYSGRWELMEAMKKMMADAAEGRLKPEQVDEKTFAGYLTTKGMPDPELLIRTSGEMRISNFLLWQLAYSELFFTDVLWPDFRKKDLHEAILSYQKRERRFGKTSEQIVGENT